MVFIILSYIHGVFDYVPEQAGGGAPDGRGVVAGVQQRRRQRASCHNRLRQLRARACHGAQRAQCATLNDTNRVNIKYNRTC